MEKTNEAIDKAKEEAIRIWTGVQEEVRRQYENLKEEAKASVKDSVNKKIDDAFDRI